MRYFFVLICLLLSVVCVGSVQAKEKETRIYALSPSKITKYVQKKTGQKKILYIYTSWCPYCVKRMPGIMDLERSKKGSVIAISVDANYADFARYAKRLNKPPFPLILNKGAESALKQKLKGHIMKPWTGYPTIVFLDKDNKPVKQGNYSVDDAAKFLFSE